MLAFHMSQIQPLHKWLVCISPVIHELDLQYLSDVSTRNSKYPSCILQNTETDVRPSEKNSSNRQMCDPEQNFSMLDCYISVVSVGG